MNYVSPAPYTLGATISASGCRFTLYAPDQSAIALVVWRQQGEPETLPMQEYKPGYWTNLAPDIAAGDLYAYQIMLDGEPHYLADPYARAVEKVPVYRPPYDSAQSVEMVRCVVSDPAFDWQGVPRPHTPDNQTVVFETHVKGLTQAHPDISASLQGKYLGLISPPMLAFYAKNQIRCLQLLPITVSLSEPHLLEQSMSNYWGYNPYLFMAPDPRFADKDAVVELKTAIRELHRAGIEVILDVVFNHTAEGGNGGPVLHYKALDSAMYLSDEHGLANYTGCGNTVDLRHPPALRSVMDTLRMWVTEYQVDGFRFDLAVTLGREGETFSPSSAFFQAVAQDPVLQQVKLIAEPWDIGPNGYQRGNFPKNWHECNDKIRDITRSLWRGDGGMLRKFASQLMGSRRAFSGAFWPSHFAVNYITYHDGFTLQDLVSFAERHNHANGENNRDGHGDNRSANYGVEGLTDDANINAVRERQKRNMAASVLYAFGVPHLLTADLRSHSQQGNNNAYCQDNPISWIDWSPTSDKTAFEDWLSTQLQRRQQIMPVFINAFSGRTRHQNIVKWMHPDGRKVEDHEWQNLAAVCLALTIGKDKEHQGDTLVYCINVTPDEVTYSLTASGNWQCVCDTSRASTDMESYQKSVSTPPFSMKILLKSN